MTEQVNITDSFTSAGSVITMSTTSADLSNQLKFCNSKDFVDDIPQTVYDDPLNYYYYDPIEKCYCLYWCSYLIAYPHHNITRSVYAYLSPLIVICGVIGNILILIMFFTKQLTNMPSKSIFQALALTDNVSLISGLMVTFLREGYGTEIRDNAVACKLRIFATYASSCASAWLVTTLTIDRLVCVIWPMKAHIIRYKHRVVAIVLIYILTGMFYSHFMIYQSYKGWCYIQDYDETYNYFRKTYWSWLDLTMNFLGPFCVIFCCNVGMVYNMRRGEETEITSTKSDSQTSRKLTRLVIVISTAFVILVMPIKVSLIRTTYSPPTNMLQWTYDSMVFSLCRNLYYSNHAINIFLYCIWGGKFRAALTSLLRCKKTK